MIRIRFIITAGGTREPIDEVRYIGNTSTGRLGVAMAERAVSRGHAVQFLHGAGSAVPEAHERIEMRSFVTSADLKSALETWVTAAPHPTVVVHAAAVADYVPRPREGKIRSDEPELVLRLIRAEKIVDFIKSWNPGVYLVKFKLESGRSPDRLREIGLEAGRKSDADLVVANDIREIQGDRHPGLIIRNDGGFVSADTKRDIAEKLVDAVESLVGQGGEEA